ncbi:Plasma membrane-associated cation-binding protein 1 [Zea mays]|uniref:Plasma membrane-associated cation-binding protein 1 n=1 Tax=Zea mays TaxID=4577 RepID=A0A1D6NZI7_MAIZE|nr:Plasma membrane-associated cation-binding protein 1 [Zea mays]
MLKAEPSKWRMSLDADQGMCCTLRSTMHWFIGWSHYCLPCDGSVSDMRSIVSNAWLEEIDKEIEDKKTELEPKVVEAYEASPPEVKALFKDKKPVKVIKKNSAAVTKFLDELAKIGFL